MKSLIYSLFLLLMISGSLAAQELSYFTGAWSTNYYQNHEEIDKKEFEELLKADTSSFELWEKHKKQSAIGTGIVIVELGCFIWWISEVTNDGNSAGPALATLGTGAIAIWIMSKALNNKRDAVLNYNKGLDQKTSFKVEPARSGLGVRLTF